MVAYRKNNILILIWKDKRIITTQTIWNNARIIPAKKILRGGAEITIRTPKLLYTTLNIMGIVDRGLFPKKVSDCFL